MPPRSESEDHGMREDQSTDDGRVTKDKLLGRKFFVGPTWVSNARYLWRHNKDLFYQVHRGKIGVSEAYEIAKAAANGKASSKEAKVKPEKSKSKKPKWKPQSNFDGGSEWVLKQKAEKSLASAFRAYWKYRTARGSTIPHRAMEALMQDFASLSWVAAMLEDIEATYKEAAKAA